MRTGAVHRLFIAWALADIPPDRLADRYERFFPEQNPGYRRDDELCCPTPLTRDNCTRAAHRVIGPEPVLQEVS